MAANAPLTKFRDIPIATLTTALDTLAERRAVVASEDGISTGVGNEWDFGTVDISDGANNSVVKTLFWNITDANSNTTADNFVLYYNTTSYGFDQGATDLRYADLHFADATTTVNTQLYTVNAITTSYTFAAVTVTGTAPSTQNTHAGDGTASIDITGITSGSASSEVVAIAAYFHIADEETTGTYRGLATAGFENQLSWKFDFS